ncbi:hypothetical protein HYD_2260 [Candidatus Hydrogenosomobacter endosymbioticus]|uniref:Uncharacterized protein n=2 Tax=Candidatus Hydrogenosomobacter endosymbioticus TaxID=2558174 RepID=A0ABN6L2Q2_9PROT|nr:hypothetical protein HYD_2260 [Candidatus Hydrogenosomobacter endosymbioticus]
MFSSSYSSAVVITKLPDKRKETCEYEYKKFAEGEQFKASMKSIYNAQGHNNHFFTQYTENKSDDSYAEIVKNLKFEDIEKTLDEHNNAGMFFISCNQVSKLVEHGLKDGLKYGSSFVVGKTANKPTGVKSVREGGILAAIGDPTNRIIGVGMSEKKDITLTPFLGLIFSEEYKPITMYPMVATIYDSEYDSNNRKPSSINEKISAKYKTLVNEIDAKYDSKVKNENVFNMKDLKENLGIEKKEAIVINEAHFPVINGANFPVMSEVSQSKEATFYSMYDIRNASLDPSDIHPCLEESKSNEFKNTKKEKTINATQSKTRHEKVAPEFYDQLCNFR